ncbi:MAG: hypothetical protein LKI92_11970 [Schleiferilactobacillus harbinensis]|jgi:hypothetical protein|nr:hypothetical protein [Schleiferilactobacillus harbinensis]MCI1913135.1 hypothetical protein [Schleiferilactobacillus harbinensis]
MLITVLIIVLIVFLLLCSIVANQIAIRLRSVSNAVPATQTIPPILQHATFGFLILAVIGAVILRFAPPFGNLVTVALTLIYIIQLVFRIAHLLKQSH